MSDTMNLDRLEQLLEELEPAEIRRRFAAELAENPRCEAMLAHFENMDADLQALADLEPAPPIPIPSAIPAAETPVEPISSRRLLIRRFIIAGPLAAALVVALLIGTFWHGEKDLLTVPQKEPLNQGQAAVSAETAPEEKTYDLMDAVSDPEPVVREEARVVQPSEMPPALEETLEEAEASLEKAKVSRQRSEPERVAVARPKPVSPTDAPTSRDGSLTESTLSAAGAESPHKIEETKRSETNDAPLKLKEKPSFAKDTAGSDVGRVQVTELDSGPPTQDIDETANDSRERNRDALEKGDVVYLAGDDETSEDVAVTAASPEPEMEEAGGALGETEAATAGAGSKLAKQEHVVASEEDSEILVTAASPKRSRKKATRVADLDLPPYMGQKQAALEQRNGRRSRNDAAPNDLGTFQRLLLTANQRNREVVLRLSESRARMLTELEVAWRTRRRAPGTQVIGDSVLWPVFGTSSVSRKEWKKRWRETALEDRSDLRCYPRSWLGNDRLIVDFSVDGAGVGVVVVFEDNHLQLLDL